MSSNDARSLVIEYWFRILLSPSFSVEDISKMIIKFADEFEQFDASTAHPDIVMDDKCQTISAPLTEERRRLSAFGCILAVPGRKYHWTIEIKKASNKLINIGIVEESQCKDLYDKYWWGIKSAYTYYGHSGSIFSGSLTDQWGSKEYGQEFGKGDVIHIWLDLKENNDLSFGKNENEYGKAFDMDLGKNYRLGVSMRDGEISIVSFDIEY